MTLEMIQKAFEKKTVLKEDKNVDGDNIIKLSAK